MRNGFAPYKYQSRQHDQRNADPGPEIGPFTEDGQPPEYGKGHRGVFERRDEGGLGPAVGLADGEAAER